MLPDFSRDVHCLFGLPFDAVDLATTERRIRNAAEDRSPCFLSTPNLNFLIACQSDAAFRNSVINSDLSVADGMPLVWISRLLGIPIPERVAGSGLFEALRSDMSERLSVYFFGGADGVAETACQRLNAESSGLMCAGFESPGYGSIEDMSSSATIAKINASAADFLVVALAAKKGQAWIEHNRARISVPVISSLGATLNFAAGTVNRAPVWMQNIGLEWLWRIKEEPMLWRRYFYDGMVFLRLLVSRVLPYAWFMSRHKPAQEELDSAVIESQDKDSEFIIRLRGAWVLENLRPLRECFSRTALGGTDVRVEMEHVTYVDSAFIGLLMLLYGDRKRQGRRLTVGKSNERVRRIFRYACAEFLLI